MNNKQVSYKQTEIGEIPENWKVDNLGSIAVFQNGRSSPDRDTQSDYPVYGANGIIGYTNKINANAGTVVIGRVGAYCGSLYYSQSPCWVTDNAIKGTPESNIDPKYLFYLLGTLNLNSRSGGSGQPLLNQQILNSINIARPSLIEQQQIANILCSLDDKIELNRKMNKTLEKLGKALFMRWFVDFEFPDDDGKPYKSSGGKMVDSEIGEIPEGWNLKIIGDFVSIDRGVSYKGKYLSNKGMPMLNLGSFNLDGRLKLDTLKYYTGDYNSSNTVSAGDIIVANTDMTQNRVILGSACMVPDSFEGKRVLFTHHVYGLRIRENVPSSYLYRVLKDDNFKNHAIGYATGTTVLFLPKEAVLNYKVLFPSEEILSEFNNVYINLIHKQELNSHEIENLSRIRDSLLPRLMSGKLRIKDYEN